MEGLKEKWAELSLGTRAGITIIGAFLVVFLLARSFSGNEPSPMPTKKNAKVEAVNLQSSQNLRGETVETIMANIKAMDNRLNRLERDFGQIKDLKGAIIALKDRMERQQKESGKWHLDEILKEVRKTNDRLDELEKRQYVLEDQVKTGIAAVQEAQSHPDKGEKKGEAPTEKLAAHKAEQMPPMRVIGKVEEAESDEEDGDKQELEGYINHVLAGGMFEGVLLTGIDAPTSSAAKQNPLPVLIRVKSDAYLPNQFQSPVKECFVVAAGYGVLSTERAEIRTEKISCVTEDGRTIEKKLDGYVVGEDGKSGMRGRLVSKQGQLIARSLMAGFLEGFSNSMKPNIVQGLDISPTNISKTQSPDLGSVGKAGIYSGVSEAAKTVAQFYLDMAKETFPVVEVDAGRRVTVVVLSGVDVEPEKEDKK